jgi:hypothetical protein
LQNLRPRTGQGLLRRAPRRALCAARSGPRGSLAGSSQEAQQGTPTYSREACRTPLHLQREPTSSSAPLRGGPSLATSRARARSRNQRRAYRRERATHLRPSARRGTLTGIPTALNAEAQGGRSSIGAWPVCRLVWDAVNGVTAVAALVLSIIVGLSQRRRMQDKSMCRSVSRWLRSPARPMEVPGQAQSKASKRSEAFRPQSAW